MSILSSLWQADVGASQAITGFYNPGLVALACSIAVLSSYVTLDLVSRFRSERSLKNALFWLFGAAFVLSSGVWSVSYIALSSLILPKDIIYNLSWTVGSFVTTFFISVASLSPFFKRKSLNALQLAALLMAVTVLVMFLMGLQSIAVSFQTHFASIFLFLSFIFLVVCCEMAVQLTFKKRNTFSQNDLNLSAILMGIGICGMQYFGFASLVFTVTPREEMPAYFDAVSPDNMIIVIGAVTVLIISIAVTASAYYKSMMNAVSNEKEFLNAMLDNLQDGIIACDSEGNITVLNDALQRYIEAPVQSITDLRKLFRLCGSDGVPISLETFPLNRALNGERIIKAEFVVVFNNGRTRDLVISGQQILNYEKKKIGAVIVAHDVTDLKKTERLKNEFVSIVSHELRTPLTSIRGSLGILISGVMGAFSEKATKLLDIANNNCDRLLLLINDILDIEKIEAGKMKFDLKIVELNEIVETSIEANRMYAEKFGLTLVSTLAPEKLYVNVDSDRLLQVLANLISNACKFSPKGEMVNVTVRMQGENAEVAIKDNGSGIPPEFQSRIFQKFSQADTSATRGKTGTGLGLNISKTIIEKFGGSIGFFTKVNEGTTFYFHLPLKKEDFKEDVKEDIKEAAPKVSEVVLTSPEKRLLICEDDLDQAAHLAAILESANYTVDTAENAESAKEFLKKHDYRALLLDLILPDQDGMSLIRELKSAEEYKNLNIVVLSAVADEGEVTLGEEAGLVRAWFKKPPDIEALLAVIEKF